MLLIDFKIYKCMIYLMIQYIELSEIGNFYETPIILKTKITFRLFKC